MIIIITNNDNENHNSNNNDNNYPVLKYWVSLRWIAMSHGQVGVFGLEWKLS